MHPALRVLLLVAVSTIATPLLDAAAQAPATNMADALIGTWRVNIEKSKYSPGPPPKSLVRTFDYTRDGRLLCTLTPVSAQGNLSVNHWIAPLDGTPSPEYSRSSGRKPVTMVSLTRVDSHTFTIAAARAGTVDPYVKGVVVIAKDGKTYTHTAKGTTFGGAAREDVVVYERQ
jgi:hypothetical protein